MDELVVGNGKAYVAVAFKEDEISWENVFSLDVYEVFALADLVCVPFERKTVQFVDVLHKT